MLLMPSTTTDYFLNISIILIIITKVKTNSIPLSQADRGVHWGMNWSMFHMLVVERENSQPITS